MCICLKPFSRLDALKCHADKENGIAKAIRCPLSTDEQATGKTFTRRDHLQQHLTGFHKLPQADAKNLVGSATAQDGEKPTMLQACREL